MQQYYSGSICEVESNSKFHCREQLPETEDNEIWQKLKFREFKAKMFMKIQVKGKVEAVM